MFREKGTSELSFPGSIYLTKKREIATGISIIDEEGTAVEITQQRLN